MTGTDSLGPERFDKPSFDSVSTIQTSPLGRLHIRGPVNPARLGAYSFSDGLCSFRAPSRQHKSLVELANQADGLVFTAALANRVISYVSFQKPDFSWWQCRSFPELLELGSIETDASWRKMGLSKNLLDLLFFNPGFVFFENFITITVNTVPSWDLGQTGLSPWGYRRLMINLFSRYDFKTWETVDPEIREHPCNILLARIGKKTRAGSVKHFASCCMGTV